MDRFIATYAFAALTVMSCGLAGCSSPPGEDTLPMSTDGAVYTPSVGTCGPPRPHCTIAFFEECPSEIPSEGAPCDQPNLACHYCAGSLAHSVATCTEGEWLVGPQFCDEFGDLDGGL